MSRHEDRSGRSDRGQRDDRGYKQQQQQTMQSAARQNEYWHLKEGIDREVITADICRYLGPDALVRPGVRINPQSRQQEEGYWVTAYRNLTSAMITDLKTDSLRWENERRNATRSPYAYEQYPSTYVTSQTHKFRQEQGPATSQPTMTSSYAPSAAPYATSGPSGAGYDDQSRQYGGQQPQQYPGSMQAGYGPPSVDYPMGGSMDYTYGGSYAVDPSPAGRGSRIPTSQPASSTYPRGESQYAPAQSYASTNDPRYGGYGAQPTTSTGYGQPGPTDPSYGRAVPLAGTTYDQAEYQQYDAYGDTSGRAYVDSTPYTQSMVATPSTTTVTSPDTNPTSRRPHGDRHGHSKHPRDNRRS